MEALDIRHVSIRPKVKRSHRVDGQEFYQLLDKTASRTTLFNEMLRCWEDCYKYHRRHSALDGQTLYERLVAKVRAGASPTS